FDNQMRSVKTLLDSDSFGPGSNLEAGFSQMQADLLKLNGNSPSSLPALTKALFDTVSAGIEAGKSVQFLTASNKLAVAGNTDVSTSTDGLTSAINAYKFSADEAEIVASKFFSAQKYGKTTIAELSA